MTLSYEIVHSIIADSTGFVNKKADFASFAELFRPISVPVAQLDRVTDSDSVGRKFESCRAYQKRTMVLIRNHRAFSILVDIYTTI